MTTAATILCLIALAGCGSSVTAQFKAGYAAARLPLNRTLAEVSKTFADARGKTVAEIAGSLGLLADRFGKELPPLEALKPPARAATAFATLTSSLKRAERDLRGAYAGVQGGNLAAAELAIERLGSDAGDAVDAAVAVGQKLTLR